MESPGLGVYHFTVSFALDISILAQSYWAEIHISRAVFLLEAPWGSRFPGLLWLLESSTSFIGLPVYSKADGLSPQASLSPWLSHDWGAL